MRFGVVFPHTEVASTPGGIAAFVGTAESCGFSYITAYDHVLGADRTTRPNWPSRYDASNSFHEVFVLLSYVAAISDLDLVVGALTLPQRQTALVAKQAAELDVLSGGRLRLGVALGWNSVEYECLGVAWDDRTELIEEQIPLLRRLWREAVVSFSGVYHQIDRVGINPRPLRPAMPLWMGAGPNTKAAERVGRLADGWICYLPPCPEATSTWATIRRAAEAAGRDPAGLGLQVTVRMEAPGGDHLPQGGSTLGSLDEVRRQIEEWRQIGATDVSITGIDAGRTPDQHLGLLRVVSESLGLHKAESKLAPGIVQQHQTSFLPRYPVQ